MPVAQKDVVVPRGGVFRLVVDVVGGPSSLAGYTGRMSFRELKRDEDELGFIGPEYVEVDAVNRQVVVEAPETLTGQYDWTRGVYDLVIEGPEGTWRLTEGRVRVSQSVTREDV